MPAGRHRSNTPIEGGRDPQQILAPQYDRDMASLPLGTPDKPASLSPGASAIWDVYVPMLAESPDLISILDGSLLADFCELESEKNILLGAMYEEATAAAKEAKNGCKKAAMAKVMMQYSHTLDKMRTRINTLRKEFGGTPGARSSLKVGPIKTVKGNAKSAIQSHFLGSSRFMKV